ncbi:MAG: tryptophan-rich sensory protein [Patescibacteria group bacterium]|nr:tryptophan-rich sensory protein [Patescibacteria group bacterium]MDD5121552.1 tryptophan-rich sensory protein [Patescibacteria group bacterium]MDD5222060.1 tryptophan-rich sensory protein [Patescibacteria group bacterium]MDD5396284.1 tryptophan-rich sensory protein [Patescibacteria group bacterium]
MKKGQVVIFLLTIIVALTGSVITDLGMNWYGMINLPNFTPPGAMIGLVWTLIFILAMVSAMIIWRRKEFSRIYRQQIMILFGVNAFLNIFWSFLFFSAHSLYFSIWEAGLLGLSVLALIISIWPKSKTAASLLIPYFLWVSFATYLTYSVWLLNK